jgi:hypothetical protein
MALSAPSPADLWSSVVSYLHTDSGQGVPGASGQAIAHIGLPLVNIFKILTWL